MSPGFLPIKATWHKFKAFLGKKVEIEDLSQGDIIIIVMGPTGSGKSSFIEAVTGIEGTVHHDLRPQRTKISVTKLYFPEFDCDIHFVDTPGFDGGDGMDKSEADIFDMISKWMIKTYQRKLQVAGLLYFHPILDNRMGWSGLSSLRLFSGLCGEELNNIVLTTTMWDLVDQKAGVRREEELCTSDRFWKRMLDRGSSVKRFLRTKTSAFEVLAPIFEQINERKEILLTQTVANLGTKLKQSTDGRELFSKIEDLVVLRQEKSTRIRNGRQDPSLTPAQFQLLLEEYEKVCLDMQWLMDKAIKKDPNTLDESWKQFFRAATSSQPSKIKTTHIPPRWGNQNWKPRPTQEEVATNPGSMGEQNPRQGRDGRMQSPSMGPVANPQPTHDRKPRSTFQDDHASQQRSPQKGADYPGRSPSSEDRDFVPSAAPLFRSPECTSTEGNDFVPSIVPEPSSICVSVYRLPASASLAEDDDFVPSAAPDPSSPMIPLDRLPSMSPPLSTSEDEDFVPSVSPQQPSIIVPLYRLPEATSANDDDCVPSAEPMPSSMGFTLDRAPASFDT